MDRGTRHRCRRRGKDRDAFLARPRRSIRAPGAADGVYPRQSANTAPRFRDRTDEVAVARRGHLSADKKLEVPRTACIGSAHRQRECWCTNRRQKCWNRPCGRSDAAPTCFLPERPAAAVALRSFCYRPERCSSVRPRPDAASNSGGRDLSNPVNLLPFFLRLLRLFAAKTNPRRRDRLLRRTRLNAARA